MGTVLIYQIYSLQKRNEIESGITILPQELISNVINFIICWTSILQTTANFKLYLK